MKRPFSIYYLPDLENRWNWFAVDAEGTVVAESDQSHFHLLDARKEAEAAMIFAMV